MSHRNNHRVTKRLAERGRNHALTLALGEKHREQLRNERREREQEAREAVEYACVNDIEFQRINNVEDAGRVLFKNGFRAMVARHNVTGLYSIAWGRTGQIADNPSKIEHVRDLNLFQTNLTLREIAEL